MGTWGNVFVTEVRAIPPESENLMFRGQRSHDAGTLHSLQTPGKLLEPSDLLPLG